MKSKVSSTSKLTWKSSLIELNKGRVTKTIESLYESGVKRLIDLAWIFPLKLQEIPKRQSYTLAQDGELFLGDGTIVSTKASPAFGRKGKGRVQLFNITVIVKEPNENNYLTLKWFNTYPNLQKKIKSLDYLTFLGEVKDFNGVLQIVNPTLDPKTRSRKYHSIPND